MKELLSKAVEENEVELTEAEYEEGIGKLKASLPPDVPLEDHLQRLGMTEDEFKEALSLDLKINKMIKEEVADIGEPTDEEIMAFYEENKQRFAQPERVKASHILLAVEPTDDEAAKAEKKAKAEEILKQINEGADFAALASQESDCPSKENGGDLGFFTRDRMVKPFADAAFEMDVDTVSDIVETRFGYHIIKVTEHEEAAEVPLEEVKERINEGLLAQKRQQAIQTYLDNLQEAANVEYPNGKPERPAPPQGAMRGMPQQGQPRPQPAQ
jgi:peptidyl-prolyl cis-trans isomerase C